MSFDVNGFLGDEAIVFSKNICKKHNEFLELCYDINRFAEESKKEFIPDSEDDRKTFATCLFIKLLEGIQATIILIKMGLDADAQIVLRGVFETLIHIVLFVKEEDYWKNYLITAEINELYFLQNANKRTGKHGIWAEIKKLATEKNIKDLKDRLERKGVDIENLPKKITIKKLAKKADLIDMYDIFYSIVSNYAHANLSALERYIGKNKAGKIVQLNHGPCDDHAKMNFPTIAGFTLTALNAMCDLYNLDKNDVFKGFRKRLDELA